MMLSKENRLKGQKNFDLVYKRGQRVFGSDLVLYWRKNSLNTSRYGLVVSLKTDKKSVQRNKLKRWARVFLKEHHSQIKPGLDIVIRFLKSIDSWANLKKEMLRAFQAAKLFQEGK